MISDETAKEAAKAVQETAKATGTIAELAGKVGGFVSRVVGGASNQIGGILEDSVRYYRYRNLLSIADKVDATHAKRRILGKPIPIAPRLAIPMLESAALEDDETLQKVWAKLIANATDANFKQALHPGFIEVVKQLSPDESAILDSFKNQKLYPVIVLCHFKAQLEHVDKMGMGYYARMERYQVPHNKFLYNQIREMFADRFKSLPLKSPDELPFYLDNLLRLRIVELGFDFAEYDENGIYEYENQLLEPDKRVVMPARTEYLRMTEFGQSFIAACITDTV